MFHGSIVALVTPMLANGEIDYDSLTQLIDMHLEAGTDAIVVAGTTGESGTLSHKEKLAIIRHVVNYVNERIPVIAGTNANRTKDAIQLTQQAMELGVDACLIMTPAYIKPTQQGLYEHYKTIARQVPIPIIVYNVPGRTACDLLPETMEQLSHISNIVGIKEATGDMNRVLALLELCEDRIDIYSGDDTSAKNLISLGGKGVISVTANVVPEAMATFCQTISADNRQQTRMLDQCLTPLHQALFIEANPIPVKWALYEMGLISPTIRLPLLPLSEKYHDHVRQAMRQAGIMLQTTGKTYV